MLSPNGSGMFSPPARNRRSLSGPLLQSIRNGSSQDSRDDAFRQNDDDAEKLQRQKERLLELQRQNLSSPATPKDRRQSLGTGLSGLTNSQLAEHYEDCIRLNAENKITVKNAFVLHLIDYMAEMLKNRDEPTNFQMASCTLDASTKIYAVRVDSVHNEVFKMVGNLGIGEEQKRKKPADEDGLENDQPNAKKKQKVKKSATIEQNVKNLNMQKLDLEYEADPLFQRMTSQFDEGGVGGLMVNTLRCLDDRCELILDSSIVPEKYLAAYPREDATFIDKSDFQEFLAGVEEKKICPTFESFRFGDWSILTEDPSSLENDVPEDRNEFAYHPASPSQLEEEDCNDDGNRCDDGFPGNDDTVADSIFSERRGEAFANTRTPGIRAVTLESLDDIAMVLADKPSDYSYFNNQLISAWAGPHHWKLHPTLKKAVDGQKDAESKKRVKKVPNVLDYNVEIDTTVKHKKSKLTKRSMMTSDIEKTTLPEDLHYAIEDLAKFMLKKNFYVKASEQNSDVAMHEDGVNYNYDNANDCGNFCPSNEDDSENDVGEDDNHGEGFDTVIDETCMPTEDTIFPDTQLPFTGDNLVQLPYKIDKLKIHYARTAKKIDVKKLKRTIWNILLKKDDKEVLTGSEKMEGETTFSQLYAALPARLSETAAQNLSVPIAFVCFLHIVNEKNLFLKGQDDYSDFTIMQS